MSGSSELPAPVALVTGATSGIGREVAQEAGRRRLLGPGARP